MIFRRFNRQSILIRCALAHRCERRGMDSHLRQVPLNWLFNPSWVTIIIAKENRFPSIILAEPPDEIAGADRVVSGGRRINYQIPNNLRTSQRQLILQYHAGGIL